MAGDPYAGPKLASREVLGIVLQSLKDSRGIHAESLFCALGAVAGHACQDSVRARALAAGKQADSLFQVITTKDGGTYYFGDALNQPLAEDRVSIWSLVAGAAAHAGAKALPDVAEIFKHNSTVIGGDQFGIPRLPPEHPLRATPIVFATGLWPLVRPVLEQHVDDPKLWPMAIGLAIQEAMAQVKGALPLELIVQIVMESAIPVSKIPIRD